MSPSRRPAAGGAAGRGLLRSAAEEGPGQPHLGGYGSLPRSDSAAAAIEAGEAGTDGAAAAADLDGGDPGRAMGWRISPPASLALTVALVLAATAAYAGSGGRPPTAPDRPPPSASYSSYVLGTGGVVAPYVERGVPNHPLVEDGFNADPEPVSYMSPDDLGLPCHSRSLDSGPGDVFGAWRNGPAANSTGKATDGPAMPTNAWYQNLLIGSVSDGQLALANRAYTIPYIVDFVGPVPGVRVHFPNLWASDTIVQMNTVEKHGLTVGALDDGTVRHAYVVDEDTPPSQLGLGLKWTGDGCAENEEGGGLSGISCPAMGTSIIRGMPYVTMKYTGGITPVIASQVPIVDSPIIDGNAGRKIVCTDVNDFDTATSGKGHREYLVEDEVSLTFHESDMNWLLFFSRPAKIICITDRSSMGAPPPPPGVIDTTTTSAFEIHVVEEEKPLYIRAALANNCTLGRNPIFCDGGKARKSHFGDFLRTHSDVYPSNPKIKYDFSEGTEKYAAIHFDWGARSMSADTISEYKKSMGEIKSYPESKSEHLLMYALPHHIESIQRIIGSNKRTEAHYCSEGLHGRACLLSGIKWIMKEDLDGPPSFVALRPPHHSAIPSLAKALETDIDYKLPDYYMNGAGDTYFSGKMLAKLGRIIIIGSELKGLAATPHIDTFDLNDPSAVELKQIVEECRKADLPSDERITSALARLRSGVEIWLSGNAEAKFVYDSAWGGVVSCGCLFDQESQQCANTFPDCPSFSDPGLNFGNGFYNDHHFHYGYLIYAAAVVANYDRQWGRKNFEKILLLIRDFANPSVHDHYFPAFRQKDWFLGSSWASGIATLGGQPYPNGRNQESSSEAIHAYEAISLFGEVMVHAWGDGISSQASDLDKVDRSHRVSLMGQLLTATEIRSAQRYWHVMHGDSDSNIYPKQYKPAVIGMMWNTMAQFQTWFGNAPYLAYGIQLIPLTPIAERRDNVKWVQQVYRSFADSCESDTGCEDGGWSVLQFAMLAVVGHRELATEKANALHSDVFESAGGNGHSRSNTLWYIATRPDVDEPLVLRHSKTKTNEPMNKGLQPSSHGEKTENSVTTCECKDTCTQEQLSMDASGYTCRQRIEWLMVSFGLTESKACRKVGGDEFPSECGSCDPDRCAPPPPPTPALTKSDQMCPPCPKHVCQSHLNFCPRSLSAPYLCVQGSNKGGCSQVAWPLDDSCESCCKLVDDCYKSHRPGYQMDGEQDEAELDG